MVFSGSVIWPESVVGWLTSASLLLGMVGLYIKGDRAKQKLMHDLNVVSGRGQETAQRVMLLEEKARSLESALERFETKIGLLLDRMMEARQEADRQVSRYSEGMQSVMTGIHGLREDVSDDFQEVRKDLGTVDTRLTRVEEAIKHMRDEE